MRVRAQRRVRAGPALEQELKEWVRNAMGPALKPDAIEVRRSAAEDAERKGHAARHPRRLRRAGSWRSVGAR